MQNTGKREALILRRRQSLLSQYEVAVRVGISQSKYSLIENGYANPSREEAAVLCELFDLEADYFNDKADDTDERSEVECQRRNCS